MDQYDNVRVERDGGVATLAIDSETAMNTLNEGLVEELLHLVTDLGEDEDVRCLVLRGSDGVFCAGGNVSSFEEDATAAANIRRGASAFHDVVEQVQRVETPLVVGIDGPAVGAGFSMALLGDVTVMHEDAYLQYGYSRIGLTGDGSSTYFLPRIVGLQEAKRIALLNERISLAASELFDLADSADLLFQLDRAARLRAIDCAYSEELDAPLFINFSPASIYDPRFCLRTTVAAIKEADIPPGDIVFTIVNRQHGASLDHLKSILDYYRSHGFRVALGMVGSTLGGFEMLQDLRPDLMFLHRSVVAGLLDDPFKEVVARKLLEIGQRCQVESVVTGVTTAAEARWSYEHGANYIQGRYVSDVLQRGTDHA